MPFEIGTATDYHDLMTKLRDFCSSELGWTITAYENPTGTITSPRRLVMRPIGLGFNRPYIIFDTQSDAPQGLYGWQLRMAIDFNAANASSAQVGVAPVKYTQFSNNPIDYWFYGNDRRIIVIGKIGTTYVSLYAGLFLPFALPTEYTRPWYIAGNNDVFENINNAISSNRFIAEPGLNSAHYMTRQEAWITTHNQDRSTSGEPNLISTSQSYLWPAKAGRGSGSQSTGEGSWDLVRAFANFRPNAVGEMPLIQCHIFSVLENENRGGVPGALDGVYCTPGFGRAPEQLVSQNGTTYRLFTNIYRSGGSHFMAIEEV